jgi:hypothetical protein
MDPNGTGQPFDVSVLQSTPWFATLMRLLGISYQTERPGGTKRAVYCRSCFMPRRNHRIQSVESRNHVDESVTQGVTRISDTRGALVNEESSLEKGIVFSLVLLTGEK